jgi:hypothetical protein
MTLSSFGQSPVLSVADHENFLARGFVHLTACFDIAPGSLAHRWVQESWLRNGILPEDRSTWPKDKIHMPYTEAMKVRDFSPKAFAAICELCGGEDQVDPTQTWSNGFIANYGLGRDKEWIAPGPEVGGWHVDGDWFWHFLDGPEQGLLIVVLFSDIHPQGGGTFIACDSIPFIVRFLAEHPEGIDPNGFPIKDIIPQCRDFCEVTGKAGDVFLLNPFTLHTSSYNHRAEARLMINPSAILNRPMLLDRRADGSAYSPLEKSILQALGRDHFDFQPTTPRRRILSRGAAMRESLLAREQERLAASTQSTPAQATRPA